MILGIYTVSTLQEAIAVAPGRWRPLVFTNACFNLIHSGQVWYLQVVKSLGRSLAVGLNSDRSVGAIKPHRSGIPCRPIVPEQQQVDRILNFRRS